MLYLFIIAVLAVIALVAMLLKVEDESIPKGFVLAGFAGITLILTGACSVHAVSSGDVGIIRTFGKISGQTSAGLVWSAPWQDFDTTTVQTRRYDDNNLTAASRDIQNVYGKVSVQYQVSPEAVQRLLTDVGPDYLNVLIPQRVQDFFKSESVKYVADDTNLNDPKVAADPNYHTIGLLQNRETIRKNVKDQLAASLAPYSITVTDMFLTDVHFDDAFTHSIESKQVAQQDALAEKNKVESSRAKGEQAKAEADGQSAAINTLNTALGSSPNYTQYILAQAQVTEANKFAQSWDGKLPQFVGTGQNSPGILLPIPGSGK